MTTRYTAVAPRRCAHRMPHYLPADISTHSAYTAHCLLPPTKYHATLSLLCAASARFTPTLILRCSCCGGAFRAARRLQHQTRITRSPPPVHPLPSPHTCHTATAPFSRAASACLATASAIPLYAYCLCHCSSRWLVSPAANTAYVILTTKVTPPPRIA